MRIDRDRASDLGVSVRDAARTLQILLGGVDLTTFKRGGETYDVIVQLDRPERSSARDLLGLYAHGTGGQMVPLVSFIDLKESTAPRALPHFDRLRSATVTGLSIGLNVQEAQSRAGTVSAALAVGIDG